MTETITILPPKIIHRFNKILLMNTLQRREYDVYEKIIPMSLKRLRGCPGRQQEFDKLLAEFREIYERKTIEEAVYQAEIKKKAQERSRFPVTGGLMRFKRL